MNSLKRSFARAITSLQQYPRTRRRTGDVGIELECEGDIQLNTNALYNQAYWTLHDDRSLRNGGKEFVLTTPIEREDVTNALREWERITNGSRFEETIRTSVHVHVNVSGLTWSRILSAVAAWWIIENPVVAYCGQHREGNLFCLRIKDSELQVTGLTRAVREGEISRYAADNNLKYSALNLHSVLSYGSLEVRPMRGLYTVEEIHEWVRVCYNIIRSTAERFAHPQAVLDHYFNLGPDAFLEDIVGEREFANKLRNVMCEKTWLTTKSIENNIPYVFELVSAIPDWEWIHESVKPPPVFQAREDNEEYDDINYEVQDEVVDEDEEVEEEEYAPYDEEAPSNTRLWIESPEVRQQRSIEAELLRREMRRAEIQQRQETIRPTPFVTTTANVTSNNVSNVTWNTMNFLFPEEPGTQ